MKKQKSRGSGEGEGGRVGGSVTSFEVIAKMQTKKSGERSGGPVVGI